jgi:hypothetical protein
MHEGDEDEQVVVCGSCLPPTPEHLAELAAQRRERELAAYREKRARRIAELGLGSHLRPGRGAEEPPAS